MEKHSDRWNRVVAWPLKNPRLNILNLDICWPIRVEHQLWLIPSVVQYIVTMERIGEKSDWEIDRYDERVNRDVLVEEKPFSIVSNFDSTNATDDKHEHNVTIRHETNKRKQLEALSRVMHWNLAKNQKKRKIFSCFFDHIHLGF